MLDVIQAAGLQSFDLKRLLTLARQAQFWRVCQIIYAENNQYDMILESSMNDRHLRSNLFRYIRTIWPSLDENERNKMRRKIMENFTPIIQIDPMKAFKLFCVFFQMDLNEVLQMINKNEKCQYEILKVNSIENRFFSVRTFEIRLKRFEEHREDHQEIDFDDEQDD